jgi:hypothetical protein
MPILDSLIEEFEIPLARNAGRLCLMTNTGTAACFGTTTGLMTPCFVNII